MTDYDDLRDDLTPAERRALFYVRRLMIDEGRMIAGVWVYRRANRRYRVGSVPSPQFGSLPTIQLWAVREVLRQARERAA